MSQYISSFNFQIISFCSELIAKRLFDENLSNDISKLTFYPDIAVLKTDKRTDLDHIYETFARGDYLCGSRTNEPL